MKFLVTNIDPIAVIAGFAFGAVIFLFTTFTTFGYVDAKHDSVMSILSEIRDTVKRTDDRVFELAKGRN